MTTIAYRSGILAADSLVSHVTDYAGHIQKLVQAPDGRVAAVAGSASYMHAFLTWVTEGFGGKPPEAQEADNAILVDGTMRVVIYDDRGSHILDISALGFYATGSGGPFAMGAMFAGATAMKAVAAGMALDNNSGGEAICCAARPHHKTKPDWAIDA
jgi:hypothetical protein